MNFKYLTKQQGKGSFPQLRHVSSKTRLSCVGLLSLAAAASVLGQTNRPTLTILHDFTGSDGSNPYGTLVKGAGGTLYGTNYGGLSGGGTVYSLTPPASAGGAWTETVLYAFAPGAGPYAGVVVGGGEVLYGTTPNGGTGPCPGGCGTAFSLAPPASPGGVWSYTLLYNFMAGTDGANPFGGLAVGHGGELYGTTSGGETIGSGTVFSLTPPASAGGNWTHTVLYDFHGPFYDGYDPLAGVVIDAAGVLYGTTYIGGYDNDGTVFSLTPPASPGGAWTATQIYAFQVGLDGAFPVAGLTIGDGGVLYGTTQSGGSSPCRCGTVFSFTPPASPGGAWTETIIHNFTGKLSGGGGDGALPSSGVTIGPNGTLYGTTPNGSRGRVNSGTVYSLVRPSSPGGVWTERVLYSFPKANGVTSPMSGLVIGSGDILYGTVQGDGVSNNGAVFSLVP